MIEPINGRNMPGYFLNDFGLAQRLITATGMANVKLQFDIYHRQIMHGDVTMALRALMPITGHVQIASVPSRFDMNAMRVESRDQVGCFSHSQSLRTRDSE